MAEIQLPRAYAKVTPLDREQLLPKLIPYGTVTGLFGGEGIGKGFLEAALAAIISNGAKFPDGTDAPQGTVIMVTPEDDPNVTTVKRLLASGANLDYVRDMTTVDGAPFTIPGSLPRLREVIGELGNVRLVILDPLGDLTSIGLTSSVTKMRQLIINPLIDLAEDTGVALILTMHTNKDGKTLQGSAAIRQALRQVLTVTRLPSNPSIRELSLNKTDSTDDTMAPMIHYTITGDGADAHAKFLNSADGLPEDVVWHDYSDDEVLSGWSREAGQTSMLQLLASVSPDTMRAGDLATRVGVTYLAARVLLVKMQARKLVTSDHGNWQITNAGKRELVGKSGG
jgi:hypothetical protein